MDYPSEVPRKSQSLAIITIFTALIVGSDFVMAGFANVKLLDSLVFLAAYLYGFRIGASVGVLSELVWAYATPWGSPGFIAPFLILGEVIYALAGSFASRVWAGEPVFRSGMSIGIGGLLALCAVFWDLETEFGTALIAFWPSVTLEKYVGTVLLGLPFTLVHEVSDLMLGIFLLPMVLVIIPKFGLSHRLGPRPVSARERI